MATVAKDTQTTSAADVQQHISWLLRANEPEPFVGDYLTDPKERPPFDYATLCAKAILSCPDGKGTLTDLYAYISGNFPYYAQSLACWQNSIRHTLSHHKCFVRVEGPSRDGRNKHCRYWTIAPDQRNLFTEDGMYMATNSRRRMRSVKDANGPASKKSKTARSSQSSAERKPSNDQATRMTSLPLASPTRSQYDTYTPALYDHAAKGMAFQWPPADALQSPFWTSSSPDQTVTPHAFSPGMMSPTTSPLPYHNAGVDIVDVSSPVNLGLWNTHNVNGFSKTEATIMPEDYFAAPTFPGMTPEVDWNAVACFLGLES